MQSKASGQLTDVVFVVHGIRTYANWIQPLTVKLTAKRPNCRVVDAGYGYFSTLNFLLPWSRQKKMAEFTDRYMVNLANHLSLPRYAVAHSFGTYVVARSLAEHPKMSFEKIYFAGSVLPREFPWYTGDGRLGIIPHRLKWLRNDCSVNDWPVGFLCSALHSLGQNQLGTGGFRGFVHAENDSMVQLKEYFPGGHSAPLDDQENLETICEYLFTAAPSAMAKAQPKPLSRSERLLNWSSEKAAVIAVVIVASLLMVGPSPTWYFTGSLFLALLAFAVVVLSVFWFLNSF